MNSNSFMPVQVRVQKKYFFEFKFEFGKMIEFFRVRSLDSTSDNCKLLIWAGNFFSEKYFQLKFSLVEQTLSQN